MVSHTEKNRNEEMKDDTQILSSGELPPITDEAHHFPQPIEKTQSRQHGTQIDERPVISLSSDGKRRPSQEILSSKPASSASSSSSDTEDVEAAPTQMAVDQKSIKDVCPDGGYGWVCVACVFMINAHTWGVNCSYGIFLSYYLSHNSYPGSQPLHYAFIGGLSIGVSQLASPAATYLIRKFGIYPPLYLGIFLQTIALLGASWSHEIWQLFLSQGVCFGLGMGFTFNATVGIIPQWFDKRRSFANSIGTAGSGVGGLIYSLGTDAMIRSLGLGWAYRILAIVSCAAITVSALLIRDRNAAIGSVFNSFETKLLKLPQYTLTLAWGCFSIAGYICMLFTLPNYSLSIGLTSKQASIVGAVFNLGQAVGRPCIGYFSDSFGRINMCLACTFACGILNFAIWIPADSYGVLILFALLGGGVAGTIWTTVAPVTAEVIGLKLLPSALSLFWLTLVIPSTFAEAIALALKRESGFIYRDAQIFTGMMFMGAAICLWFVRAWKVREVELAGKVDQEKREQEIRDDDQVPHGSSIRRVMTGVSLKSVKENSRGLWAWTKV